MTDSFKKESLKKSDELGSISIGNDDEKTLSIEITKDGVSWSIYQLAPKDKIRFEPNLQGLSYIKLNSEENLYQLQPGLEYAVKFEDAKKVLFEIERPK